MSIKNFISTNETRLAEAELRYRKRPSLRLEKEIDWLRLLIAKARTKKISQTCFETEQTLREKYRPKPKQDEHALFMKALLGSADD